MTVIQTNQENKCTRTPIKPADTDRYYGNELEFSDVLKDTLSDLYF